MAERLTDARVRSAPIKPNRYSLTDARESGLELRVHANGRKTWALRASVEGKDCRLRLGTFGPSPLMSLEEARANAAAAKVRLRSEGDFRGTERAMRDAERETRKFTVNDLADAWLKDQAKRLRESTLALYRLRIATHIRPRFGDRPLMDVKRADVRAAIDEIGGGHRRTANSIKQILAAMYRFAQNELERECGNPAADMRGYRLDARERVLADDEIKTLLHALADPKKPLGPIVRLTLKFVLYSAQRPGEVAGMRENEIDADEGLWTITAARTKSNRAHCVPLTRQLLEMIDQARALRPPPKDAEGGVLPFPPDAPVFGVTRHAVSRGMARLLASLGTEDDPFPRTTPHDLRRTARTLLSRERLGVTHDAAERLLAHQVGSELSRTYDRHSYTHAKRHALDALHVELNRIVSGKTPTTADDSIDINRSL